MSINLFDQKNSLKSYKPIPFMKKFKFFFKMADMYAEPVTMRYKNQKKFFTNFGAIASVCVYLGTFSILLTYITDVFSLNPDLITSFESNELASFSRLNISDIGKIVPTEE